MTTDELLTRLLTPKEAAARLAITVDHLAGLVKDGEIAYIFVGRGEKRPRRRFTEADLDAFIERRRRREVYLPPRVKTRRMTTSASRSEAVGFTALRNARVAEKQKRKR
ncbi:MAG: helix-turn-helix domain-containing protein [Xanthobacteraceae bacterium]